VEALLSTTTGAPGAAGSAAGGDTVQHAVQFMGKRFPEPPPASKSKPKRGKKTAQRREFSLEEYIAMWEKEQGTMSAEQKETLKHGCIGITAANLEGTKDPLKIANLKIFGTFEQAEHYMLTTNKMLDDAAKHGVTTDTARLVLFAKLFWSNQALDPKDRTQPNPNKQAFRPDPKTREVSMAGYHYEPRSVQQADGRYKNLMNYDYGFWDQASRSFWHANHGQPANPPNKKAKMMVLQSSRETFESKLNEEGAFDRIVYCVARAHKYNPRLAAISHDESH
jgi:hypothetical protein